MLCDTVERHSEPRILEAVLAGLALTDVRRKHAGWGPRPGQHVLIIPSPWLILPPAILCLWVAYRRRHYRGGICQECAYDLTGNVSGVCPECGTKVPFRGPVAAPEMPTR